MSTRIIRDPFTGKDVEISNRLTDRLRGKYACGPIMENGEPEFGWRQHEVPPIQIEAADHIEVLEAALKEAGEMWVRKDNRIEALEASLVEWKALAIQWAKDNDTALAPEQDKSVNVFDLLARYPEQDK